MSVFATIAGAIGSGIADKAVDKALDNNTPASDAGGIGASMVGNDQSASVTPAPMQSSGSMAKKLSERFMEDAFSKGINSVLNPRMNAREQGQFQREYLESAFPNMNEWERAGATATQAGVQAGQVESAKQMQDQQLRSNERIQAQNNKTAVRVAEINAKSQNDVAGINSQTSMRNVDKQVEAVAAQVKAQTGLLIEQAKRESGGKGALMTDVYSFANMLTDTLKGKGQLPAAARSAMDLIPDSIKQAGGSILDKAKAMATKAWNAYQGRGDIKNGQSVADGKPLELKITGDKYDLPSNLDMDFPPPANVR